MSKVTNFYRILEVSNTASQAEIKRSFRNLALKYHPDRNKSVEAEEMFKKINPAYQCLKNPNCLKLVKLIRSKEKII